MTLVNIITQALVALGMSTDAQSTEVWKNKLTIFANDGMRDIAEDLQLRREDEVEVKDGAIELKDLPRSCVKVLAVTQDGSPKSFTVSKDSKKVLTDAVGSVKVEYRYIPQDMSNDIDVPDIPDNLHALLVPYTVYSEHMTRDPNTQRRADMFYQKYMDGKRKARRNMGETDTYSIMNYGW